MTFVEIIHKVRAKLRRQDKSLGASILLQKYINRGLKGGLIIFENGLPAKSLPSCRTIRKINFIN